ncbi:hypothetical protein Hdeb2414_s0004g00138181 [Helianthus debilis subsp. tardiflorus]
MRLIVLLTSYSQKLGLEEKRCIMAEGIDHVELKFRIHDGTDISHGGHHLKYQVMWKMVFFHMMMLLWLCIQLKIRE